MSGGNMSSSDVSLADMSADMGADTGGDTSSRPLGQPREAR
jgi:hypothetical protein